MHTGESSATTPGAWASSWTTGTRLATWSQPTSGTPPAPPRQTWFLSGQGSASPCSGTPSQSGCASPPDLPIYLEWGTRPTFLSSALRGMCGCACTTRAESPTGRHHSGWMMVRGERIGERRPPTCGVASRDTVACGPFTSRPGRAVLVGAVLPALVVGELVGELGVSALFIEVSVGLRMLIAWLSASGSSSATFVVRGLSSATCRTW
jgi:hypothetical protein